MALHDVKDKFVLSCGPWRDEGCREFGATTRASPFFEPHTAAQVLDIQQDQGANRGKSKMS